MGKNFTTIQDILLHWKKVSVSLVDVVRVYDNVVHFVSICQYFLAKVGNTFNFNSSFLYNPI